MNEEKLAEIDRHMHARNHIELLTKEAQRNVWLALADDVPDLVAEVRRLQKNDYTEDSCVICLGRIREREARCRDFNGPWMHPLCKVANERDDAKKVLGMVARAAQSTGGYIGQDGQLLKEVERVLAGVSEKPLYDQAKDETLRRVDAGIQAIKDMSTIEKPKGADV